MHHATTLHELVRLERADALRRGERPRPQTPGDVSDEARTPALAGGIGARLLQGLQRRRKPSLPHVPAA